MTTLAVEALFLVGKILILHTVDISLLTPRVYVESVVFCGLIFLMSKDFLRFLNNCLLRYVGKISYSIYLLHLLILTFLTRNDIYRFLGGKVGVYTEYFLLYFFIIIISVVIGSATFFCIELPGQKIGKYIFKKIS